MASASPRVAAYLRVSTEEQARDGYSIAAQERACRDYCRQRGWDEPTVFVDEGTSAHTDAISKRPAFRALLDAVEARQVDIIIVHKFDRFSRSMALTVEAFRRLSAANCGFVSITEQFDYTTPQGRLFLHMLAALAEFYSQSLSQETKKGKHERKAQGLYNGLLPFGVVKDERSGLPVADRRELASVSTNYDGLLLAFREAAAGRSDAEIAAMLNAAGYRTTGNRGHNLWRKDSVRRMLMNRFYLGELPGGIKGRHEPLIECDLFDRAQAARAENTKIQRARSSAKSRRIYSLTGLLRCWYCAESGDPRRGPMRISFDGEPRVRCAARIEGLGCEQRSLPLALIEEQITIWLEQIEIPDDAIERALATLAEQQREEPRAEQDRRRLESRLERLKELYSWGDLSREDYLHERDQLLTKLRSYHLVERQRRDLGRLAELLRSAPATWQAADQHGRNQLALTLIEKVVLRDDRIVAIVPRADVAVWVPTWEFSSSSGGGDGDRCPARMPRYVRPRLVYCPDDLARIARTARASSISAAARQYGVARQTVRRACKIYGQ